MQIIIKNQSIKNKSSIFNKKIIWNLIHQKRKGWAFNQRSFRKKNKQGIRMSYTNEKGFSLTDSTQLERT
ncbi:hypothetical protein BST98_04830 [Photobacterium damselae]|nr:hypothetical protein BST98_04830 [Photobacterium damselae]